MSLLQNQMLGQQNMNAQSQAMQHMGMAGIATHPGSNSASQGLGKYTSSELRQCTNAVLTGMLSRESSVFLTDEELAEKAVRIARAISKELEK